MFKYDSVQLEKDLTKIIRYFGKPKQCGFYTLYIVEEYGYELSKDANDVYFVLQRRTSRTR